MIGLRPWAIPAVLSRRRGVTWAQFFSGRVGAVWDPRLLSQMSTSRTGGTFGTVIGDTVGFVVDQARGGTAAMGAERVVNGGLTAGTTSWSASGATIAVVSGELEITRNGSGQFAYQQITTTPGATCFVTVSARNGTTFGSVYVGTSLGGTQLLAPSSLNSATTQVFRISFVATSTTAFLQFSLGAIGTTYIDNLSVRELPGIHMVAPTDARRATLVGYAGGSTPALYASGSHGYASSAALDLSGSDEVTVIMQVRSLLDGATQVFMEFSNSLSLNNGVFTMYRAADNKYNVISKGTLERSTAAASANTQPDSAILVFRSKIGADTFTLSRNGTQIATSSADQGSGNFTAQPVNWMIRNAPSATLFATAEFGTTAIIGGALSTDDLATAVALAAY